MSVFRLSKTDEEKFAKLPEQFMGVQLAQPDLSDDIWIIVGGQIAFPHKELFADVHAPLQPETPATEEDPIHFYKAASFTAARSRFLKWKKDLKEIDGLSPLNDPAHLALVLAPAAVTYWPFPWPAPPYGHLPYSGTTGAGDVFFRCEPFPVSSRLTGDDIAAGTFAIPMSELPFIPTGFSAVGRYALPSPYPACYRWTITPANGAALKCGASVPLYGQAGGGVEVKFDTQCKNTSRFVSPAVLPPL